MPIVALTISLSLSARQLHAVTLAQLCDPSFDPSAQVCNRLAGDPIPAPAQPETQPIAPPGADPECLDVPVGATGIARLERGDRLTIEQLAGNTCVDVVAWSTADLDERFSATHTRALAGANPTIGTELITTPPAERVLLTIVEDSAPGHDLLFPACSSGEFAAIGCMGSPSCFELHTLAAQSIGASTTAIPDPLNLWFSSESKTDGTLAWRQTPSAPGDRVTLAAEAPCFVATNPCVSDLFACSPYGPGSIRLRCTRTAGAGAHTARNLWTEELPTAEPRVEFPLSLPAQVGTQLEHHAEITQVPTAVVARTLLVAAAVAALSAHYAGGR